MLVRSRGDVSLRTWLAPGQPLPPVEVSAGSHLASVSATGRRVFHPSAPWTTAGADAVTWFPDRVEPSSDLSRVVGVFDVGTALGTRHQQTFGDAISRGAAPAELDEIVRRATSDCLSALEQQAVLRCISIEHESIHITQPSSPSTAFDYESGSFVGLHIDNEWLKGNSFRDERNRSFGVVGVNLGSADRYLLFVDRSATQLAHDLARSASEAIVLEDLKDAFLDRHPEYPVFRICLKPGRGYFCNPQHVLHDAATNHAGRPDVSLLVFGHFDGV